MISESSIVPFIKTLAYESAHIINPLFADPDLKVELKADNSPVTYADRKAEETMRALIEERFPDHGIVGEEFGVTRADAEYTWVLDPIDGTRSFAANCPLFGTLICLRQNEIPIWGAIHISSIGKLYIGNNEECWCNDRPVRVPKPPPLNECFLLTSDHKLVAEYQDAGNWNQLINATGQYRSWGDCFGYTLLASGGADIMADPILEIWDISALIPVIRGAGAKATDWQGQDPIGKRSLVCAHPDIHDEVIAILNA